MSSKRLTIGMATYRDFDGVYFSINALRMYHADVLDQCELLVVDNDPDGPQKERLQSFMDQVSAGISMPSSERVTGLRQFPQPFQVRYIEHRGVQGTTAPRQKIFEEAAGDAVLVIDSHVNLWPNSVSKLLEYYRDNPKSQDLIQGPLVMDNMTGEVTHMDDVWRGGMWGVWGAAWVHPEKGLVAARESSDHRVAFFGLMDNREIEVLNLPWCGHESKLLELGFQLATDVKEAFEIPAHGLGLYSCRKDAWLGFNEHFREFGGEEWYIHEKFRQHGHKCLCLPWLKWVHRFADPSGGRHYTRTNYGKVRNYILGHQELNLPLDRVKQHFLGGTSEDPVNPQSNGGDIGTHVWDHLVQNPLPYPINVQAEPHQPHAPTPNGSLESLYENAKNSPSDINEHCEKLKELATLSDSVVEFGHRPQVSTVALLAGQPNRFVTFSSTQPENLSELVSMKGQTQFEFQAGDSLEAEIDDCDLLFIDTIHTANQLRLELKKHQNNAKRFIVLHDTEIFGVIGESGQDGLLIAIRELCESSSEWEVIFHAKNNHGLTVLSCRPEDHLEEKIFLWSAEPRAELTVQQV